MTLLGEPDQVIGRGGQPYMLRWFLFRSKNDRLPRLYLHKFLRPDDDRAPHDHPWWFVSILLKGSYVEHRWADGVESVHRRRAPSIAYRPLSTQHRVDLMARVQIVKRNDVVVHQSFEFLPVWTIILTGPDVRKWGFWCKETFVPWREFDGCGE